MGVKVTRLARSGPDKGPDHGESRKRDVTRHAGDVTCVLSLDTSTIKENRQENTIFVLDFAQRRGHDDKTRNIFHRQ